MADSSYNLNAVHTGENQRRATAFNTEYRSELSRDASSDELTCSGNFLGPIQTRRAWEIVSSFQARDPERNYDIDEYLCTDADHEELVEGWSALMSHEYPYDIEDANHEGPDESSRLFENADDSGTSINSGSVVDVDVLMAPISNAVDELNANISLCIIEKTLLEETIPPAGQAFQMRHSNSGERFIMYPDIETVVSASEEQNNLEQQLSDFVSQKISMQQSRLECWKSQLCLENSEIEDSVISSLPDEIMLAILSYVPQCELLSSTSLVCKKWYILSSDSSLWHSLLIPIETVIEPHRLCLLACRCPNLKTLSVRGNANIRDECLSVITQYCPNLTTLDFGFCQVTEKMLSTLARRCPRLIAVNFEGCQALTSNCIRLLCLSKGLRYVDISYCVTITDNDIVCLVESLEEIIYINMDGNSFISDRSVVALCRKHKSSLLLLTIDGAESTDESLRAISCCEHLLRLTVSFADNLTDKSITYLLCLRNLRHLQLRKNQIITTNSFCQLFAGPSLKNLIHLDLSECLHVDDSVISAICKCCVELITLNLCWCWSISDVGIKSIVDMCRNLESLDLLGIDQIEGDSFITAPENLPNLKFLNLAQCNRIKDQLFVELVKRMPQLTAINFYHEDFRDIC